LIDVFLAFESSQVLTHIEGALLSRKMEQCGWMSFHTGVLCCVFLGGNQSRSSRRVLSLNQASTA